MKKYITTLCFFIIGLLLFLPQTITAANQFSPEHNQRTRTLYQERINYYLEDGWTEWRPTLTDLGKPITHSFNDQGVPKQLGYRVSGIDTANSDKETGVFPRPLVNLVGYEGQEKIETQYYGGNGFHFNSTGLWANSVEYNKKNNVSINNSTFQSTFSLTNNITYLKKGEELIMIAVNNTSDLAKDDSKKASNSTKEKARFNDDIIMTIGNSVYETHIYPDAYMPAFRSDFYVYNTENTEQNISLHYYMDAYLRNDPSVPIKGMPLGRGVYFEEERGENNQRLSFSFPRSKTIPAVQYGTAGYNDSFLSPFKYDLDGIGVENDTALYNKMIGKGDQGVFFKQKPIKLKPGEKTQFSLLAGLIASNQNPEIYLDTDDAIVNDGQDITLETISWYDYLANSRKGTIYFQVNGGKQNKVDNYIKKNDADSGVIENISLDHTQFNIGENDVLFTIVDQQGKKGTAGLKVIVRPQIKFTFHDKITGQEIDSSQSSKSFGWVNEYYGYAENKNSVRVPSVIQAADFDYVVETSDGSTPNTENYELKGTYTSQNIKSKQVKVNYIRKPSTKPSFTVDKKVFELKEKENSTFKINGTFKNPSNSNARLIIYSATETIEDKVIPKNTDLSNWESKAIDTKLFTAKGPGTYPIYLSLSKENGDSIAGQEVTVHVLKNTKVNFYLGDKLMDPQPELPKKEFDQRLNTQISIDVPATLNNNKYHLNRTKTTGLTENTINRTVSTSLNEIAVYYDLSDTTVTVHYLNREVNKQIFKALDSKDRMAPTTKENVPIGTNIETLLVQEMKDRPGYTYTDYRAIKGNEDVTGKPITGETTVYLYYLPKSELTVPSNVNFGKHQLKKKNDKISLNDDASIIIENTKESRETDCLVNWSLSSNFSGFSDPKTLVKFRGFISYNNINLNPNESVPIQEKSNRLIPTDTVKLNNSDEGLQILIADGNLKGKYNGIITWSLEDVL
ncbi:hypothetical protein [Vagococcus silagei]|uniref:MucBP domain-containing protein n=1 Tax=Vagococcus silagei TaxID=2508885 RepID=A0A4V3TUT6_9ENTE|nr:hypothetical protein [Vagococcus silagei]THB60259.1 hypothetical protein ESZ54_11445 [Vagococcus silagei]